MGQILWQRGLGEREESTGAVTVVRELLPNRVIGNVLIAAGAFSIGFASTLTRLGNGSFLDLGEVISAVLMFARFLTARPQPQEQPARQNVAVSAD